MRLINTNTLKLEEFHGTIPEYAILSHTWTSEEVSFEAFTTNPTGTGQGYNKIAAACGRARSQGLGYCWVDTCCIAKSSSAELSEAINSMFAWYKQAKVCFVYLADFNWPSKTSFSWNELVAHLEKCRWFTRGWCLQELIAPKKLIFFDVKWWDVGHKDTLGYAISKITGVPGPVLQDSNGLSACSVAERMSWASNRQTTRVEDVAYSLLGLFDVAMPMLYGEGEKAFMRLQEEIIKRSNDLSIFAWEPDDQQENAYVDMFAPSPRYFASCRNARNAVMALSTSQFTLTNSGVHFTDPDLVTTRPSDGTTTTSPAYRLLLGCYRKSEQMYLDLNKVGPGVFVRRVLPAATVTRSLWTAEQNISIIPKITPEIRQRLEKSTLCIKIQQDTTVSLSHWMIRGVEPRQAWDELQWRILFGGANGSASYLKISPNPSSGQSADVFIAVLRLFEIGSRDPPKLDVCLVHPDNWAIFDLPGRALRTTTILAAAQQVGNEDGLPGCLELDLSKYKITAKTEVKPYNGKPVNWVSFDWKRR